MFVQIIKGKVKDPEMLERQVEKWRAEVKPGAKGYLGSTGGTTADGTAINIIRFESEADAMANSDRPEQATWWAGTEAAFDGEPTFINSSQVDSMFGGGSNDAGFVQIMEGRAHDPAKMREMGQGMEEELSGMRPDILGGTIIWHGDREFTQVIYFRSEAEARAGEQGMDADQGAQDFMNMIDGDMTFYDLTDPDFD